MNRRVCKTDGFTPPTHGTLYDLPFVIGPLFVPVTDDDQRLKDGQAILVVTDDDQRPTLATAISNQQLSAVREILGAS